MKMFMSTILCGLAILGVLSLIFSPIILFVLSFYWDILWCKIVFGIATVVVVAYFLGESAIK